MQTEQAPLILTLRLDAESQVFFDRQRQLYFPAERNWLKAHLTLFHQLPDHANTRKYLKAFTLEAFDIEVTGLQHLGAGVAYRVESQQLNALHKALSDYFKSDLIPQDRQPFRPHIVVQNKVTPEASKKLLTLLNNTFEPFKVKATGLELWTYLGGPWRHECSYGFKSVLP